MIPYGIWHDERQGDYSIIRWDDQEGRAGRDPGEGAVASRPAAAILQTAAVAGFIAPDKAAAVRVTWRPDWRAWSWFSTRVALVSIGSRGFSRAPGFPCRAGENLLRGSSRWRSRRTVDSRRHYAV